MYFLDYQELMLICEIFVLISDDIMIEKKQTIYEKLSDNNIKKYKKIRYVLIWKQRYEFLKLSWLENKKSDMSKIRNFYQNIMIINDYTIRLIRNMLQSWEFYKFQKNIDSNFHN